MAAATANVAVLLLLVIHVLGVVVGAARPLERDHGWTGNGIEMVDHRSKEKDGSNLENGNMIELLLFLYFYRDLWNV
ncbi:hypothetical protein CFC21_017112 [Triticum aestivum]|uniref:Uncharacterized protein n=3 Tax=Triticum TaxID=4564 RepID=A0A9R1NV16_TRITD|nr:hypothetical protein CFC21_017112 [Triticum aestivum]VAH31516.1 unnamed protein product [Triticum turgidum subsp. durum]